MAYCYTNLYLGVDYTKDREMFSRFELPLISIDRTMLQNYQDSRKMDVMVRSMNGRRRKKRKG